MIDTQNPPFCNGGPGNLWSTYHLGWKIHATNFGSQLRDYKSNLNSQKSISRSLIRK